MMPDKSQVENRHQILTVYGRNAVFEALSDASVICQRLHWATSNKNSAATQRILDAAAKRDVPVRDHTRATLARISKNGKQDQGVALDIHCPSFGTLEALAEEIPKKSLRLLALDGITNPQNLGMIIRAAVAGGIDGILYPRRGIAALGPLVIKSSAGTLFRAPLIQCDRLCPALEQLQGLGLAVASLEGDGDTSVFDYVAERGVVYVLGGETEGVSKEVSCLADVRLTIPMARGVESLNVAVAAALVAYQGYLSRDSY